MIYRDFIVNFDAHVGMFVKWNVASNQFEEVPSSSLDAVIARKLRDDHGAKAKSCRIDKDSTNLLTVVACKGHLTQINLGLFGLSMKVSTQKRLKRLIKL